MERKNLIQWDELLFGGIGAVCAGIFTNPLDVIKTRIQLQGELKYRGQYQIHYRNVFHAFYQIYKNETIYSLQKGLVPALWYQLLMNGCRFGIYQICDNSNLIRDNDNRVIFYRSILCSISSGVIGSFIGSPLYLIKTQLQSQSVVDSKIAVGYQHQHQSMLSGFLKIYKNNGILGLWRGSTASIVRVSVGGSIQLTSFTTIKTFFNRNNIIDADSWYGILLSSMIGSCFVVISMTPFDVVSTRIYNQPIDHRTGKGKLYKNIPDCMIKIFKTEGLFGFYKGFSASFLRLGPHTILSIFFWQLLRNNYYSIIGKNNNDNNDGE